MFLLVLLLLGSCLHAQTSFSLKKEGNSIVTLHRPEGYSIIEDTISSMLRIGKEKKYIDYYFRRTRIYNAQCYIQLYSRLSPVFDSLTSINHNESKKLMIYDNIVSGNKPSRLFKGEIIYYKISPMKQHYDGYYYADIFETTYQNDYSKYVSSMKRIFVIDGIEHEISVYSQGYPYNKTVCSSRKAVCHVFEELVNSLVVE